MICVMCFKYRKQKKAIEESRLVPGARSEADEWLLVNKLVNQMKMQSGPHNSDLNRLSSFNPESRLRSTLGKNNNNERILNFGHKNINPTASP